MPELKDPNHSEDKRGGLNLFRQSVNWFGKSWIGETWLENRVTFKRLAADFVFFLIIMASISFGHSFIEILGLPEERRQIVELIHFSLSVTAWVWFSLAFLAEIFADTIKRILISWKANKTNANES